jgi:thymidine kinase
MIILILGPMFSSKTTTCISYVKKYSFSNKKCMFIGHSHDTRYRSDEKQAVITHDKISVEGFITNDLNTLEKEIETHDVIGIDEIQFFGNESIELIKKYSDQGKVFVCSGLNGDYNRKCFESVYSLIGMASDLIFLKAVCVNCAKHIDNAVFSYKKSVSNNSDNISNNIIEVGGIEKYIPVCESCYVKLSN